MYVHIEGFLPKKDRNEELELHSTKISQIEQLSSDEVDIAQKFVNLVFLREKMYNIIIRVKFLEKESLREFIRDDGSTAIIFNCKVEDLTDKARLSAWNDEINKLENVQEGAWIEVTAVRSKSSSLGKDLTLTKSSKVRILQQ